MKTALAAALVITALAAATAEATVPVLFEAWLPLLDPQAGVTVRRVTFRSAYARPEAAVHASVWPYRVNAGPGETAGDDINAASLMGIRLGLGGLVPAPGQPPQLTLDLREISDLPERMRTERPELGPADVVRALADAIMRNLESADVAGCRLVVLGADERPELRDLRLPSVLNPRPQEAGR